MGYYAGDPGLFDFLADVGKGIVSGVTSAGKFISGIPGVGQLAGAIGGPIGTIARIGEIAGGFQSGGLTGGLSSFLRPVQYMPGIGGTVASLGLGLLSQAGPPAMDPGGNFVPPYSEMMTGMVPPWNPRGGYRMQPPEYQLAPDWGDADDFEMGYEGNADYFTPGNFQPPRSYDYAFRPPFEPSPAPPVQGMGGYMTADPALRRALRF